PGRWSPSRPRASIGSWDPRDQVDELPAHHLPAVARATKVLLLVRPEARLHSALFCDPPRFTSFEPPEAASWAFQYRTAWRTPRSAAASRRTSWPRRRRCVQSVKSRLTGNAAAGNAYKLADMASLLQAVRARTT